MHQKQSRIYENVSFTFDGDVASALIFAWRCIITNHRHILGLHYKVSESGSGKGANDKTPFACIKIRTKVMNNHLTPTWILTWLWINTSLTNHWQIIRSRLSIFRPSMKNGTGSMNMCTWCVFGVDENAYWSFSPPCGSSFFFVFSRSVLPAPSLQCVSHQVASLQFASLPFASLQFVDFSLFHFRLLHFNFLYFSLPHFSLLHYS